MRLLKMGAVRPQLPTAAASVLSNDGSLGLRSNTWMFGSLSMKPVGVRSPIFLAIAATHIG